MRSKIEFFLCRGIAAVRTNNRPSPPPQTPPLVRRGHPFPYPSAPSAPRLWPAVCKSWIRHCVGFSHRCKNVPEKNKKHKKRDKNKKRL